MSSPSAGHGDATIKAAISAGIRESLVAGVTTLGEIATAPWRAYAGAIRPRLSLFAEVIGFSQARAESAFVSVNERLAGALTEPELGFGIGPHAPYTVSLTLLKRLVNLARRHNFPVAMHLAESVEELEFLKTGRGSFRELLEERSMWDGTAVPAFTRPVEYMWLLCQAPRSLVIHGNYLDAAEQELLAASAEHMSLVYCPRTHAFFQHAPYPLAELLMRGIRVALGTDSRASNPDLNFIAEIREAIQKHRTVAPQRILEMATLDGAVALGRETEIGSLCPGKSADIVALSLPPNCGKTADEQLMAMFSSNLRPAGVWLRGVEISLNADGE